MKHAAWLLAMILLWLVTVHLLEAKSPFGWVALASVVLHMVYLALDSKQP